MRLSRLGVPFTCLVVHEPSVRRCLDVIEKHERSVDSFEINLAPLGGSGGSDVFRSTGRPCIAACRRRSAMTRYGYSGLPLLSEKSRAEALTLAVTQGAAAADLELDTFGQLRRARSGGRQLAGLSMDPAVVRRQTELNGRIRSAGAEVVMSCHLRDALGKRDAVKIAREARKRGAQFANIVSPTPHRHDLFGLLACGFALSREAEMPFALSGVGAGSGSDALPSLLAGSSWVYCRSESENAYGGEPTVEEAATFIESLGLNEG